MDRDKLIEEIKKYCGDVDIEEDYIVVDTAITNASLSKFLEFLEMDNKEHEKI